MATEKIGDDMLIYNRDKCITFSKTKEPYGELGNMASGFPLTVPLFDGSTITAESSEVLYQALRFPNNHELQREILAHKNAFTGKIVAKAHKSETRPDWNNVRLPFMQWAVELKASQHIDKIRKVLQGVGSRPLVELSPKGKSDQFWAATIQPNGTLVGENHLGRMWDAVNLQILSGYFTLNVVRPPMIHGMALCGKTVGIYVRSQGDLFQ
jgi:predicted NAD-dependent protein-ADP-ribosyltransferase YbiA (DUF1768 family)